jgi:hypothetical protein
MSSAVSLVGPANAIPSIPSDLLQRAIVAWARGLKYVSGRIALENALDGALKVLTQGVLVSDLWFEMFAGVLGMIERPGSTFHEGLDLDIAAVRAEEEDAKHFDTTFSKLRYAELPSEYLHPELRGENLTRHMAITLAEFSQAHPGLITTAIEQLSPTMQSAFRRYPNVYGLSFA